MRTRCGFWVVVLAVFALLSFVTPHAALAQSATAQMCADGSFDKTVENNRNSAAQDRQQLVVNVTNQFPIIAASNACVEAIIKVLTALPSLADPFSLAKTIILAIVTGIIGQICAAVMSEITAAQSLLANTLSICLPLPNFSLNLNTGLQSKHCSGGMQFSLISGYTPSAGTSYSASGMLGH